MILNVPELSTFISYEKDFDFAPESIRKEFADEYIRQINAQTEFDADYGGASDIINTYAIVGDRMITFTTKVID
jgi:hypothetical protein